MRPLRFLSAVALVSHPQVVQQSLDWVAHSLYPLLFKASYWLEQESVVRALLGCWPLAEFRLDKLLAPSTEQPEDLRERACRVCLEACVQGLADHVLRAGASGLRLVDFTGLRDVQVQQCPCGRALGRWGRTELLARTCCALQAELLHCRSPVQVVTDIFVTEGNFQVVMQALAPQGAALLQIHCVSLRADSLGPGPLLQVLSLAGPAQLRRLQVVHNVPLHAGHVQQLLTQMGLPQLSALTLPAKALEAPPAQAPSPNGEDPLFMSIAQALSQMTQLTELSVAFSELTGKIQKLLGSLNTPLKVLDLASCSLNHADMAFLADCNHAAHLEGLDLSGHSLVSLYPSSFYRLLRRAAPTLKVLTLEECGIEDSHVSTLITALSPCHQLQELRFLGNPLSSRGLRRLFLALAELPQLHWVEFPVPRDCYPEGAAYPQDELTASKFDQHKYDLIAQDLQALLLRAGRGDVQASTPLYGSFDPDIQETSHELGSFLLQAFKTALENFSRALKQME